MQFYLTYLNYITKCLDENQYIDKSRKPIIHPTTRFQNRTESELFSFKNN